MNGLGGKGEYFIYTQSLDFMIEKQKGDTIKKLYVTCVLFDSEVSKEIMMT